jgi:hypothetical protein
MKKLIFIITILLAPTILLSQNDKDEMYMNAFIVIADSSQVYSELKLKMFNLKDKLNVEIDTMGRGYNKTKDLICLPENDEDEIYAGDYFPRRFPSETLSLEYLDYYDKKNGEKTIGLIVGIFQQKEKLNAERLLKKLSEFFPNAYILNTDIYMGCMH